MGFKIRSHNIFLHTSYRKSQRKILDWTLNENHKNWYPMNIKPSTVPHSCTLMQDGERKIRHHFGVKRSKVKVRKWTLSRLGFWHDLNLEKERWIVCWMSVRYISVINVTAHWCASGLQKKFDLHLYGRGSHAIIIS